MHAFIVKNLNTAKELAEKKVQFKEDLVIATSLEKDALSIDDVRKLISECYVLPLGNSKVVIIPNADLMRWEAQNALLKIIEEPPEGVEFYFIVEDKNALLPTIRSRCLDLGKDSQDINTTYDKELYAKLEKLFKDDMNLASNRYRANFQLGELKDRKEEVITCLEKIFGSSPMQLKLAKAKAQIKANCNWAGIVYEMIDT